MSKKLFGLALAGMMVFTVACAEQEAETEDMPATEETLPAPAPAPMTTDTMGTMGTDTGMTGMDTAGTTTM